MKQPAPNTSFPLLQSVMKFDSNIGVGAADTDTNSAGVTVSVDSQGNLIMTAPSLGIKDLPLKAKTSDDELYNWTRSGVWVMLPNAGVSRSSPFVTGYETALSSIPASGSATYNGATEGLVYYVSNNQPISGALSGKATFTANFGERTVTGAMTEMKIDTQGSVRAWNDVAFNANILTDRNGFSGTTSVSNAPGGAGTLPSGTAPGTIEGRFYGPAAQEAGAVWTLHSGNTAVVGTIRAKQ